MSESSNTRAIFEVQSTYAPPNILISCESSADLSDLWEALDELGWPVADRDQSSATFLLAKPDWPLGSMAEMGNATVDAFRAAGVETVLPDTYEQFLRKTAIRSRAQAASADFNASAPIIDVTTIDVDDVDLREFPSVVQLPRVLLLSEREWTAQHVEPHLALHKSVVHPGRKKWIWSESSHNADDLGQALPDRRILLETVEFGWTCSARNIPELEINRSSHSELCFVLRDPAEATKLAEHLSSTHSSKVCVLPMAPLPGTVAFDEVALVVAVVSNKLRQTIGAEVITLFPDAIGRGKPATAVDLRAVPSADPRVGSRLV